MRRSRLLPLVILLLGVGFALVPTTLLMTGNVKIATNNGDFDVKFTKAVLDGRDVSSSVISQDGKSITFGTSNLSTVGEDISKLEFEVTNNSEMYDATVGIDCTAAGEKSSYYHIEKEVATPIAGKRTEVGKVEVSLLKAPVDDIHEEFTCTLNATARERTEKAEKPKYTPKYFEFGDPTTVSIQNYATLGKNVFLGLDADESQKSVCIIRNDSLECFRGGNTTAYVAEEQAHVQEVFCDIKCDISTSSDVRCDASDFYCRVYSSGSVSCRDDVTNSYCSVHSDGSASCG